VPASTGRRLARDSVLEALRSLPWRSLGARWVVLFGSLARRGTGRDVDLLAAPRRGVGPDWRLHIAEEAGEAIGCWGCVDVVEAGSDTPCTIILDAWRHGIVIFEEDQGEARSWLLVRVKICGDYRLAAQRLGLREAARRAARRRWATSGGIGEARRHSG